MEESSSTYHRTLVKTATYRAIALAADVGVVFILTGQINTAIAFGGIMVVVSTGLYFFHERAWSHISWGRNGKG